jgi:cardiolipin synthase
VVAVFRPTTPPLPGPVLPEPDPPAGGAAAGPSPVEPIASDAGGSSGATAVDGAAVVDPRLDRILTVPNVITLVRLLCLPVFWWLLFSQQNRVAAAALLSVLGATDWVDGYIARHFGQVSNLGKVLDPTVDRLLFFVAIVGIIIDNSAPRWFCFLVLVREVVVAGITVVILRQLPVDVTWFGKPAPLLMFAFPLFLAGSSDLAIAPIFTAAAWIAAVPGLVFSYYAAFRYIPLWRVNLREGRARRAAEHLAARG